MENTKKPTLEQKKADMLAYSAGLIGMPLWLKVQVADEKRYVDDMVDR